MIGASSAEIALTAVLQEPDLDARIRRVRKTLTAIESLEMKATHRVCQTLRRVILSVKEDVSATPSQKELAAEFYQRVRKVDPRRAKTEEEKEQEEEAEDEIDLSDPQARLLAAIEKSRLESSKPKPDGYEPGFVSAADAVTRITNKYGSREPEWTDISHTEVLQAAFGGDLPLDDHNVRQLWLALANGFHGGSFPNAEHTTLLSHLVAFANQNKISLPTPNCFVGSIREELDFRS